jgi:ubiquinone/menaquinone biosynthesis C-methylase UbiE
MKEKILSAYQRLSKDYETNVDSESAMNAFYERPALMNLLPVNVSGLRVLDAGCAAGWYSEQLSKKGASVVSIDFSPEMVEATKRRIQDKGHVFVHDLCEPLPFDNGHFDLIICSLTLHYLEDWETTFQEFQRVLKVGGQLIFSIHHPFADYHLFNCSDYFIEELLEDEWEKKEAGRVKIYFYRRPLQNIINKTTKYFKLIQLVEPQPAPEFQDISPVWYEKLMKQPHFLVIQAEK